MYAVFRYLRGYLRIYVTGYSTERFMNLCSAYGICLWDIEEVRGEGAFSTGNETFGKRMNIAVDDFRRLRLITRKTGTKVRIVNRFGFPFFLRKCRLHKFFMIGLLLCLLGLFTLSKYIWSIDLTGNTRLTEDSFEDFLSARQVHIGMKISELDIDHFEKELRDQFDYITWTSAKIVGTRLIVEIKENEVFLPKETVSGNLLPPTDLISQDQGTIFSMITRSGVPFKKTGDSVSANELLVSGRIPVYQDDGTLKGWHECNADADVVVEYTDSFRFEQKTEHYLKVYDEDPVKRYGIRIGTHFWEIGPTCGGDDWEKIREYKQLNFKDFYLPVYYGQTVCTRYRKQRSYYRDAELKCLLLERYKRYEDAFLQKGVQIIGKSVKIERKNDKMVLYGTVKLRKKTGRSVPSEVWGAPDNGGTAFE
ncbi:MAG: hypothetical protein E7294_10155 [Lachnospiraceae bacterium]|jgi:similar to stage IV sporulation protein|nr:hypothetical protein [Lachnospiraceae bacterium]